MRFTVVVLIFLLAAPAYSTFKSGSDLASYWEAYKWNPRSHRGAIYVGYIEGAYDVILSEDPVLSRTVTKEVTPGQVCRIVGKYLEAHPEEWHQSGGDIVRRAIRRAFLGQP
jgi:hypothetical protein